MSEPARASSATWNNVRVTLTTHSEGGLTDNDFQMARRIDGLDG
jgi:pterin-4a-carbinolamine dehydratase